MKDYQVSELSEAKYAVDGYELRQVVESGKWAMFASFQDDYSGFRRYYILDDDWGVGNVDDESLFSYRVEMQKEELRCLMADF